MRASVIGLIAIPVAASGVAAAAVVGFRSTVAPSAPSEQTATASLIGEAPDESPGPPAAEADPALDEVGGTAIDGTRPYLTVIDGLATLPVPAPIPSFLGQLTGPPVALAPLPPQPDEAPTPAAAPTPTADDDEARSDPDRTRHLDGLPRREPVGRPGSDPREVDRAGDDEPRFETHSQDGARPGAGDPGDGGDRGGPAAPDPGRPPVAIPGLPGVDGPQIGRPPHVGEPGRPPHAGEPGRPPHAGEPGRPPHAGGPERPSRDDDRSGFPPRTDRGNVEAPATDTPAPGRSPGRSPDAKTPPVGGTGPTESADDQSAQR